MKKTELYAYNYLATDLKVGDKIDVLGSCFGGQPTQGFVIDAGVQSVLTTLKNHPVPKSVILDHWLKQVDSDINLDLFRTLYQFTLVMDKYYPGLTQNRVHRLNAYQRDNPTLSDMIRDKKCACAEYAVLAQMYLQSQGFNTTLFSGGLLMGLYQEIEEPHTFILLSDKNQSYIFDPVNMMRAHGNVYPRVARIELTPNQMQDYFQTVSQRCGFLSTRNLWDKSCWYYGCGDHGDVTLKDFYHSPKTIIKNKEHEV